MKSMQASLAMAHTVALSWGGGARRTMRSSVVPGVRMMIRRHVSTARRCAEPGRTTVTPRSEGGQRSLSESYDCQSSRLRFACTTSTSAR